jgi:hypothetical protein
MNYIGSLQAVHLKGKRMISRPDSLVGREKISGNAGYGPAENNPKSRRSVHPFLDIPISHLPFPSIAPKKAIPSGYGLSGVGLNRNQILKLAIWEPVTNLR